MKLTKFEQSGFLIEARSFVLAVDIGAFTSPDKLKGLKPDAMIVSHLHGDHLSPETIAVLAPDALFLSQECMDALHEPLPTEIVRMKSGEKFQAGPFSILPFDVDHGPNVSIKPKENFGFLIEADGEKLWFGGDIFYPSGLDPRELELDKALIPVGGFYTFGPQEAADFAGSFKNVGAFIPMHYEKTPETADEFLRLASERGLSVEKM